MNTCRQLLEAQTTAKAEAGMVRRHCHIDEHMAMGQNPGERPESGVVTLPQKGTLGFDPQPHR